MLNENMGKYGWGITWHLQGLWVEHEGKLGVLTEAIEAEDGHSCHDAYVYFPTQRITLVCYTAELRLRDDLPRAWQANGKPVGVE